MKLTLAVILLIVACICFILAALKVPSRVDLTNAGFAFVVASWIVADAGK